jgi:hypothetical protein
MVCLNAAVDATKRRSAGLVMCCKDVATDIIIIIVILMNNKRRMDVGGGGQKSTSIIDESIKLGMLCATTRGRREECPAAGPRDGEIDDADLDMHIYPFPQLLTFFQFANSSIFTLSLHILNS